MPFWRLSSNQSFSHVLTFMMSRKGAEPTERVDYARLAVAASLDGDMDIDEPEFDVDELPATRYALILLPVTPFLLSLTANRLFEVI